MWHRKQRIDGKGLQFMILNEHQVHACLVKLCQAQSAIYVITCVYIYYIYILGSIPSPATVDEDEDEDDDDDDDDDDDV